MSKPEVESLVGARAKLASVLEIHAPIHPVARQPAIDAMTATLQEFEAAVREDERSKAAPLAGSDADLAAANALASASPTARTVDAPGFNKDGTTAAAAPLGAVSTADGAPLDAGKLGESSTPREIGEMPPVPTGEGFKGGELTPPPSPDASLAADPESPFNKGTPGESVLREPLTLEKPAEAAPTTGRSNNGNKRK